jgi:hypothetical protein
MCSMRMIWFIVLCMNENTCKREIGIWKVIKKNNIGYFIHNNVVSDFLSDDQISILLHAKSFMIKIQKEFLKNVSYFLDRFSIGIIFKVIQIYIPILIKNWFNSSKSNKIFFYCFLTSILNYFNLLSQFYSIR